MPRRPCSGGVDLAGFVRDRGWCVCKIHGLHTYVCLCFPGGFQGGVSCLYSENLTVDGVVVLAALFMAVEAGTLRLSLVDSPVIFLPSSNCSQQRTIGVCHTKLLSLVVFSRVVISVVGVHVLSSLGDLLVSPV